MNEKRKKVEEYILDLMDEFSKFGGNNAERYRRLFKAMNDDEFDRYMHELKAGNTQLSVIMPNNDSHITTNAVVELANRRGVKIFQRVNMYDPSTNRKYLSKFPMMVVVIPVRRLAQYLFHKISLPEGDSHLNPVTGQVIPPDKGAALSMIETQILASKGLETSIVELLKVRAGDMSAYRTMKYTIEDQGDVSVTDIPMTGRPRSVITMNCYLHALGIAGNL